MLLHFPETKVTKKESDREQYESFFGEATAFHPLLPPGPQMGEIHALCPSSSYSLFSALPCNLQPCNPATLQPPELKNFMFFNFFIWIRHYIYIFLLIFKHLIKYGFF
jgi:hypothetical protein